MTPPPSLRRAASGTLTAGLLGLAASSPGIAQSRDAIGDATLPLPETDRAAATVLVREAGAWRMARTGAGPFVCLADDPGEEGFHVACYHESLEPYMARGRELAAAGVSGRESLARRWKEIEDGTLAMPEGPSALRSLTADSGWDGDPGALQRLTVLYVPYATPEELGLPTEPAEGVPWLMFPGKPTAHLMIHR
ncbi:MAG: hypothetical protein ACRELC_02410 [Gemmatimonadota bacterium]